MRIRRVQSCSSDIIIAKKAQRDNEIEIRGKHIFLIVVLLLSYHLHRSAKGVVIRCISRAKCYEEFSNYIPRKLFSAIYFFDTTCTLQINSTCNS